MHVWRTTLGAVCTFWYECPLVVLASESLHVCTVCIWRCEHARFCVEVFYVLHINFHSFIHSIRCAKLLTCASEEWANKWQAVCSDSLRQFVIVCYRQFVTERQTELHWPPADAATWCWPPWTESSGRATLKGYTQKRYFVQSSGRATLKGYKQ